MKKYVLPRQLWHPALADELSALTDVAFALMLNAKVWGSAAPLGFLILQMMLVFLRP